jgi:hypothetical protein
MSLFPTLSIGRSLLLGTSVVAAIGFGLQAQAADTGQATVKSDSTPVYSRTSARAPVVKTFQKGDRVTISFEMLNAEGAWCGIAGEPGQKTNLVGYMPCEHLEREPEPQPVIIATKPASSRETPQRPAPAGPAQPAPGDSASLHGENYMRELSFWTGWPQRSLRFAASPNEFNFTTDQQAQVEDLANRMGVTACRQQIEAHYRRLVGVRYGVPDLQRYSRIMLELVRERDSFFYPCDKKMLELLERVPTLMTPEQRSLQHVFLDDFEKDLAKWRRALTSPNGCCYFVPTQ